MQGTVPLAGGRIAAGATPILLAAKLYAAQGRLPVTLVELTAGAATATAIVPPPLGSIVVLSCNGVRAPGTVAWVDQSRFGLQLEEPMHHRRRELLLGVKPRRADSGAPDHTALMAA